MIASHEEIWIDIANQAQTMSTRQLVVLIKCIEEYFDDQADTELGDMLEMFAQILFEHSENNTMNEVHQDVQDLLVHRDVDGTRRLNHTVDVELRDFSVFDCHHAVRVKALDV